MNVFTQEELDIINNCSCLYIKLNKKTINSPEYFYNKQIESTLDYIHLLNIDLDMDTFKKDYLDIEIQIKFDEYTPDILQQIQSAINTLKKQQKSCKINFVAPLNGFRKDLLTNLIDLSKTLDMDFFVSERGDEDASSPLHQAIEIYAQLDTIVNRIKALNLSPFEQFLAVHDYAANRIYKEVHWTEEMHKSRALLNVMSGDNIVCVGYANIVKELCNRLAIDCKIIRGAYVNQNTRMREGDAHVANIVHIVDEKYGIDGYYFCDACWDSKNSPDQSYNTYTYSAIPIQDIKEIPQSKFFSSEIESYDIPPRSNPIPIEVYRQALNNIYQNPQQVEEALNQTIKNSYYYYSRYAENDFAQNYYHMLR